MAFGALKGGTFILTVLAQFWLTFCPVQTRDGFVVSDETNRRDAVNQQVDSTQAEMMLNLLRSSVVGRVDPRMVGSILDAHGTYLIISQQNISRTVTREQYRTLLLSMSSGELPDIAPADLMERSRRGVEGLRKDVWPSLRWGRTNTSLLAQRIEEVKRLDLSHNAVALASRFLPERVALSPRLYVVIGGRAGAASLAGDEIYFDVLATSYRAANGTLQYPTAAQIGEYFAHEIHHLGLSQIIDRTRRRLRLSNSEQRAFNFLTALIMEGGASYLINGHRSLRVMRRDPQFAETLKKSDELVKLSEHVLRSLLEDNLDGEAYEKATTPFLGSGWHSAGATMLAAIDRVGGLRAVLKVLRDPRRLLVAYNRAVTKFQSNPAPPVFDARLVKRISAMGTVSR